MYQAVACKISSTVSLMAFINFQTSSKLYPTAVETFNLSVLDTVKGRFIRDANAEMVFQHGQSGVRVQRWFVVAKYDHELQ